MSESDVALLAKFGWYKEIYGKDERRRRYRILREAGIPAELARRARDWSDGHLRLFLRSNSHLLNTEPERVIKAIWGDAE